MPIIQPFTGRLILGEPVRPAVVIGAAIAIAGTAVFIAGQDAGTHSLLGDALVAAGMLCSCANQLLARRVAQRRGRPMAVSALQLTAAAGVGMCALLTIDRPDSVLGGGDRQNVVLTLVYLGVFASAVPFFLYNFSLRSLPVGRISLFVCLLAPLATPMSAVYLGTSIRLFDIAAMMIVVVGILLPAITDPGARPHPTGLPMKKGRAGSASSSGPRRSLAIADGSPDVTVKWMPVRIAQTRMTPHNTESQIGLFRSDQSTSMSAPPAGTGGANPREGEFS